MRAAEIVTEVLKGVIEQAKPGVDLLTLDGTAGRLITLWGAESVNKGYFPHWAKSPFPSVICLSVNNEINHAPARSYVLQDGDLLTIDCGLRVDSWVGDAGVTIGIGTISSRDERLIRYTRQAVKMGIKVIMPGVKITEVGKVIEGYANLNGYVVNHRFGGHGVGKEMHEDPMIPMYDMHVEGDIPVFYEGQIVCIEPHLTYNDEFGTLDADGWTLKTRDGKKSAMAEHMVRVTSLGAETLTSHF